MKELKNFLTIKYQKKKKNLSINFSFQKLIISFFMDSQLFLTDGFSLSENYGEVITLILMITENLWGNIFSLMNIFHELFNFSFLSKKLIKKFIFFLYKILNFNQIKWGNNLDFRKFFFLFLFFLSLRKQ